MNFDDARPRVFLHCGRPDKKFLDSISEGGAISMEPSGALTPIETMSKSMIRIAGTPIVEHVMRAYSWQIYYRDFILCLDPGLEPIRDRFSTKDYIGWKIEFQTKQSNNTTLEHIIEHRTELGDHLIISSPATLTDLKVDEMVENHTTKGNVVTAAVTSGTQNYAGVAVIDTRCLTPQLSEEMAKAVRSEHPGAEPLGDDTLYQLIKSMGKPFECKTAIAVRTQAEWKTLDQLWREGKAFWPGAYAKRYPDELSRQELVRLAKEMPQLGLPFEFRYSR